MHSHQISRVQLKKWTCHAHLKFQKLLAGNPNPKYLEPSNFVQSRFLQRLTTGENLVLISLTSSEIFKFEIFFFLKVPPTRYKITFQKVFLYIVGDTGKELNWFSSNNSKLVTDISQASKQLFWQITQAICWQKEKALAPKETDFPPKAF